MDDDWLDDVPNVVVNACMEAAESAKTFSDFERRRHLAIVVCHCEDADALDVARAIPLLPADPTLPAPGKAVWGIVSHARVADVGRDHGYIRFPEVQEPGRGLMRVFLFTRDGLTAGQFVVEDEADVLRAMEEEKKQGDAFARRILDEKHDLIRRAMHRVLAKPGLRERQIIVVFGGRTGWCTTIYRELAALPAQEGFPPELPPGVPVIAVDSAAFLGALAQHVIDPPRINPAVLGPKEVYVAVLMPRGVFTGSVDSVPYLSMNN